MWFAALLLVDQGEAEGSGGKTPLILASSKGHVDLVKFLLDNGADVNAKAKIDKNSGSTSLHDVSERGIFGVAKLPCGILIFSI